MAISNTARILIVAVVIAVIVVVVLMFRDSSPKLGGGPKPTDVVTEVILDDDGNGRCKITTKAEKVEAYADRQVRWEIIENDCDYKQEVVTVGNFRYTPESTAPDNCKAAVEGNTVWPFAEPQDIKHRQTSPNRRWIELHILPAAALPGTPDKAEYYYDICTGDDANVKADPMLVIEK